MSRQTKRSIAPASRTARPTRRGIAAQDEPTDPIEEPFFSSRPTKRDVQIPEPIARGKDPSPRGQFSIPRASGVPVDVVSGTIERTRRKTRNTVPPDEIYFVSATKRQITFVIQGRSVTLDRSTAIEIASRIFTSFGED